MSTVSVIGMAPNMVVDRAAYNLFWQFIYERHMIWYKRCVLEQPVPWTDNKILRDYKFTNVYRELDRGTLYLLDNIVGPVTRDSGASSQVFNIIMYRIFNRIETWEAIKDCNIPWQRVNMFNRLRRKQAAGEPLYTDAHMVCAYEHFPGDNKLERVNYIFNTIEPQMPELMDVIHTAKSLQTIHKRLTEMKGIGPFLAYEMAVDISYAPWNNLGEDEWVNPGPGCQRGLRRIFPDLKMNECTWLIRVLRQAQEEEFVKLNIPFSAIAYRGRQLTLRNIEHCLCEFFKYCKAMDGTGRPRNRFTPTVNIGDPTFDRLKG